jgi:hypothetical protein
MNPRQSPPFATILGAALAIAISACGDSSSTTGGSASAAAVKSASAKPSATIKPSATASATSSAAASEGNPCKEESGTRVCTAGVFQKAWKATPVADRAKTFPPATYKISGKVKKIDPNDSANGKSGKVAIYVEGDSGEVLLRFDSKSKDLADAKKAKEGDSVTYTCKFAGLEETGIVTMDDCSLK